MSRNADVDVDVIVVGGGPVGLAAAIEARLGGLTVAVVEPRADAIDKACGEGIMPGAVPALARLGVVPSGHPLRGVGYRSPRARVDHRFRGPGGLGVRRTVLSAALAERAEGLGVHRVTARVDSLEQDRAGVSAGGVRGRYLLGADGLHSTIRSLIGVEVPSPSRQPTDTRRFGFRRHFAVAPWSDLIEVHFTRDVEVYVTPVADDLVGIAVLGPAGTDFAAAVASVPEVADRIADAQPASTLRGAGPFQQRTTRRSWGRVMLVGDASGYVDAITGEGIRIGLAQGRAAIASIAEGRPGHYERAWREATRDFRVLTSGLVALATSPARGAIVPVSAAVPRAFGAIVERLAR
ncbi:NAD(P)/FAD-dependent oxidoreductase [Marisediminicola sp. LYQ134]|uniref:NAD(P)/FAD-dependent oxidoreductase n=1 Tax=Marisediminicola sp. LYQ134 TaxID=3391061 RepID=UPI0039830307